MSHKSPSEPVYATMLGQECGRSDDDAVTSRDAWPLHARAIDIDALLETAREQAGLESLAFATFDRTGRFRELRMIVGGVVHVITAPPGMRTIRVRQVMAMIETCGDAPVPVDAFGPEVAMMFAPLGVACRPVPVGTDSWVAALLLVPDAPGRPDLSPAVTMLVLALSQMEHAGALVTGDVSGAVVLEATVMQSARAIIRADASGRPVTINPAAARVLGLPDSAIARPWLVDFVTELGSGPGRAMVEALACPGAARRFELTDAAGVRRTIEVDSNDILDESGERMAIWADVEDVSERLESEADAARVQRLHAMATEFHRTLGERTTRTEILDELCRVLVDVGGFPLAWVADNDADLRFTKLAASAGLPSGHGARAVALLNHDERSREFWQQGVHTGLPLVRHIDCCDEELCRLGQEAGMSAVAMFSLQHGKRPGLVLMVYTAEKRRFDTAEFDLVRYVSAHAKVALDRVRYAEMCTMAEKDLVEVSRWMLALVQSSPDAIISIDTTGKVVSANPAAARLAGIAHEDFVGRRFDELLIGASAPAARRLIRQALNGRPIDRVEGVISVAGGTTFWAKISVGVIRDERGIVDGIVFIGSDVSQRKHLEALAKHKDEQLRRMAADVVSVADRQRREIAADLHDGLGQTLAAMKINIDVALGTLGGVHGTERIARAQQLAARAIGEIRTMTFELYPPTLRTMGLAPALELCIDACRDEYGGRWVCACEPVDVCEEVAATLYRVAVELTRNAAKHAQARTVELRLRREGERVVMTVFDDGRGMERTDSDGLGIGLTSALWQVERVGGSMVVESSPQGSVIAVSAPLCTQARCGSDAA